MQNTCLKYHKYFIIHFLGLGRCLKTNILGMIPLKHSHNTTEQVRYKREAISRVSTYLPKFHLIRPFRSYFWNFSDFSLFIIFKRFFSLFLLNDRQHRISYVRFISSVLLDHIKFIIAFHFISFHLISFHFIWFHLIWFDFISFHLISFYLIW